jgi:spore coat polysaccharide biosynthesis predicted glycosyltransferase SpsG
MMLGSARVQAVAVFRVDGGPAGGMGHLVRMHALSLDLRSRGIDSLFLTAHSAAADWLQARGECVERIALAPGSLADAESTRAYVRSAGARLLVTDGYVFREPFLRAVVESPAVLVSIDDLAQWPFPSKLVVNGTLGAERLDYDVLPGTRLLLGPRYLLLRPPFRPRPQSPSGPLRLFVCFGGADPDDQTARVVDVWRRLQDRPPCEVVLGPAYGGRVSSERDLSVHRDLEAAALANVMARCDLAVVSGGMVACELAALDVPMVVVVASPDQERNAETLSAAGAARALGRFSATTLSSALRELAADVPARREMARRARDLVDGRGCERVAEEIVRLLPAVAR